MGFTNYIQQITASNGTTYDLVDSLASHYVKGTQSASTNAWTGALPDGVTAYYDGLAIDYFLPYAGTSTAATLNLGSKGAKPVYVGNGNSAVTTHFPQYSVIHLTYIINSGLNSGNGCWKATSYYDTNTTTWSGISGKPTATGSNTTGISIAAHGTGSVTGVQSTTTTASKASGANGTAPTLGTAISLIGVQSTTTTASKVTVGSHSTDYGVKSAGSASTWTFEEKTIPNVTSAGSASSWTFEEKTIPNVTAAGSGSASLTFAMDTTDTKKLKITFSHTHTAPTIGTAIKVQSKSGGSNGTAPTLGTAIKVQSKSGGANSTAPTLGSKVPTVSASDVTVPIKNANATSIPNVTSAGSASTWSFTDVTVPIKNTSASTFVTGTTHTVTDNGHTHSIG